MGRQQQILSRHTWFANMIDTVIWWLEAKRRCCHDAVSEAGAQRASRYCAAVLFYCQACHCRVSMWRTHAHQASEDRRVVAASDHGWACLFRWPHRLLYLALAAASAVVCLNEMHQPFVCMPWRMILVLVCKTVHHSSVICMDLFHHVQSFSKFVGSLWLADFVTAMCQSKMVYFFSCGCIAQICVLYYLNCVYCVFFFLAGRSSFSVCNLFHCTAKCLKQ